MAPKVVDKDERRLQILEAGVDVMAEKGYYNTKIDDIAKVAGIGKGTVYQYFKSKEAIFEAMVDYHFQDYVKMFDQLETMNLKQGSDFIVGSIFTIAKEHEKVIHLFLQIWAHIADPASNKIREKMEFYYDKYQKLFDHFFKKAQANGEVSKDCNCELLSQMIFGALDGIMLQAMLFPEKLEDKVEEAKAMIYQWISRG